jgi:hypothetical protein
MKTKTKKVNKTTLYVQMYKQALRKGFDKVEAGEIAMSMVLELKV